MKFSALAIAALASVASAQNASNSTSSGLANVNVVSSGVVAGVAAVVVAFLV